MKVKDLIIELLKYPMNNDVVIQKELAYNICINADIEIKKKSYDSIVITFDFPTEEFYIERKSKLGIDKQ